MSTRKSSVGVARRVVSKPHIPYRGDDLGVGKKTGIAVDRVDRKSDGFELFEDIVKNIDKRSPPPRTKANMRRKSKPVNHVEEVVEDESAQDMTIGEVSMELDDSMHPSILIFSRR
jgi:centromere protein C